MRTEKLVCNSSAIMPVIAALPYSIIMEEKEVSTIGDYDPKLQKTIYAMGRDYSTCRVDESVWPFLGKSKSDTKKDD